jgi:16S rRNA (cytosine967-C5)-methyltransferase
MIAAISTHLNLSMSPAREIAYKVLYKVANGGYATDLLHREHAAARDIALAEAIVLGCLRYQAQLDHLMAVFSGRTAKLDIEVRIALRMAIFQLRYMDRIPTHAAVDDSVELVKRAHKRSATGFVNAVLRKVHRDPVAWPDRATELSMPPWLLARWDDHYGPDVATRMAGAALTEPAAHIHPTTGRQQDIGAQSIVPLLDIHSGNLVLDLCAAPGNKTAQILAVGARTVACDRYAARLAAVDSQALRVQLNAATPLPFGPIFDRILLDAPCSGTGTLARNPEIKWRLRAADLADFQSLQRTMLTHARACLKPSGKLVYATCSLEPEENEHVASGATSQHHRLPGRDVGDGFFAAEFL